MSKRDYYEILGVNRTCTEVELKAAFRKLAMKLRQPHSTADIVVIEGYDGPQP